MTRLAASTGVVLAFTLAGAIRAAAEDEGAWAAAPTSCVVEQFALRSYVTALRTDDTTSPARDPARLPQAITPLCRQAIDDGRWPGLATELLSRVPADPGLKKVICQLAPPEALSAITGWERDGDGAPGDHDVACAVALLRDRPAEFERIVAPRLTAGPDRALPPLAAELGSALDPEERLALLPVLDFATQARARGRDRLFGVLCAPAVARARAACQEPATLEPRWDREARIRRAAWRFGLPALLLALAGVLWRSRRRSRRA